MKKTPTILAYVRRSDSTIVSIDVVKFSKRGTSFLYNGKVYRRCSHPSYKGVAQSGESILVLALSHDQDYLPEFVNGNVIVVEKQAVGPYRRWINQEKVW